MENGLLQQLLAAGFERQKGCDFHVALPFEMHIQAELVYGFRPQQLADMTFADQMDGEQQGEGQQQHDVRLEHPVRGVALCVH